MDTFIGRLVEMGWLNSDYRENKSQFCIIYGRRRVGKSTLIRKFCEGKKAFIFQAGREKKNDQIKRFLSEFSEFVNDPVIAKVMVSNWNEVLKIVTARLNEEKIIFVLDEFQWMGERSIELISDLQRYWDNIWKNNGKMILILCGSAISFMTSEVLSEKSPLFGRRTREVFLEPFTAKEASLFFPERSLTEKGEALIMLGGIPKYLEMLKQAQSVRKNINALAFTKGGLLVNEVNYILSEQLRETTNYFRLLRSLSWESKSAADLAKEMRMSTGQTLYYLHQLEKLKFVSRHIPITKEAESKSIRYKLMDEYLGFYFYYIEPNMARVLTNVGDYLFERITQTTWNTYCGLTFQLLCEKNIDTIIGCLGISDTFEQIGTYWQKRTLRNPGIQIDLVIECSDHTTYLIECKWSKNKVGMGVADELDFKKKWYPNPRGHTLKKVLIASHGVTKSVSQDPSIMVLGLADFF